ncbi:MAG: hypothetical protein ACOVK9_03855, partial [Bacteroidia bacterium]
AAMFSINICSLSHLVQPKFRIVYALNIIVIKWVEPKLGRTKLYLFFFIRSFTNQLADWFLRFGVMWQVCRALQNKNIKQKRKSSCNSFQNIS